MEAFISWMCMCKMEQMIIAELKNATQLAKQQEI
jgi:hypothetical protein